MPFLYLLITYRLIHVVVNRRVLKIVKVAKNVIVINLGRILLKAVDLVESFFFSNFSMPAEEAGLSD